MTDLLLTGLDGANPLGFFAALGILRVLARTLEASPKLAWRNVGRWRPVLSSVPRLEDVLSLVRLDLHSWRNDPVLSLAYSKHERPNGPEGSRGSNAGDTRDLKPSPRVFRCFLEELAEIAGKGN